MLICFVLSFAEHTEGTVAVYVVVKGVQILLAETIVLFYECGHYERYDLLSGDIMLRHSVSSCRILR